MVLIQNNWRLPLRFVVNLVLIGLMGNTWSAAPSGPVARHFLFEQGRSLLNRSFYQESLLVTDANRQPLDVYLLVGDIAMSFDNSKFRPDAAIMPTNRELEFLAKFPITQKIIISRAMKSRYAKDSILAAKSEKASVRMATEPVLVRLKSGLAPVDEEREPFPSWACFLATDFSTGGSGSEKFRDLFEQQQIKIGVRACLSKLDEAGVRSVVMPLLGAASSWTQEVSNSKARELLRCRTINSIAGISLGIKEFSVTAKSILEIGIIQYDKDIRKLFFFSSASNGSPAEIKAYQTYAKGAAETFRRGLQGIATKQSDLLEERDCNKIFGFPEQTPAPIKQ